MTDEQAERFHTLTTEVMQRAALREVETAHLPVLLGPWRQHPDGAWMRVARHAPGFRFLLYNMRRFVVSTGPVVPGHLMWWSNGGGGGPEIGEAGKTAADACARSRGYAMEQDDGSVVMPDGSIYPGPTAIAMVAEALR